MRRIILFVLVIFKYALYAVAGFISLYVLLVVGEVAYLAIGETMIPGFKLSDHMSKDQSCTVYPMPEGCPVFLGRKLN
jgi:hypothetical protein